MTTGHESRVILVTGANSGIGEAIAVAFQQTGAAVFGLARRREALEAARARASPDPLAPRRRYRRDQGVHGGRERGGDEKRVSISRQTRNDGVPRQTYAKALRQHERSQNCGHSIRS
jgi:NAD(P)-dependent dehydrogenase (short-subunit alcohol dehydrogenase family)